ncbi:hypothetical protein SALWKB12_1414 [Snodgrassella communis]|jgi:hypothetical protein|uniref:Uncharacterized protein n=1 Tax=Snodgrassella communis TaxID=2946699 RepID=A0A837B1R0_9NEIS|nr:hypothetical protein SALWKB12_1414 [Snodgrassella communis]KDN14936.1 hypothetical protein SALWKB29_1008 [Snodgrassella communis]
MKIVDIAVMGADNILSEEKKIRFSLAENTTQTLTKQSS